MTKKQLFPRAMLMVTSLALLAIWPVSTGLAESKSTGASGSSGSQFLLIAPHTPEQCLAALDAIVAMPDGKMELEQWAWGCMAGDHTGYLIVSSASAGEALKSVPEAERAGTKAIKLNKFTAEQIKSFHEMKK